jgi:hypothetical protein
MSAFKWDENKENAAALFAVGDLSWQQIADQVGVTLRSVETWHATEDFKARIAENREIIRQRVLTEGVANKVERVRRLNKRWSQINQIFDERAEDVRNISEPGYGTGLLNCITTTVTKGDMTYTTDEFKPEIALLKEEREIAKQAAIEVGDWTEKQEVSGNQPVLVVLDI